MAKQSVTGSGQPGLSTVPQKHAMGDMAPVRELPYGPDALAAAESPLTRMTAFKTSWTNIVNHVCAGEISNPSRKPER
jgi:hypothetical protein